MALDPRRSLRTQLVAIIALLNIAVSSFLLFYFPARMEFLSRRWVKSQASGLAKVVATSVAEGLQYNDPIFVFTILKGFEKAPAVEYAVVRRADGTPLSAYGHVPAVVPRRTVERGDVYHVVAPIRASGGARGTIAIGYSLAELLREKQSNFQTVAAISAIVLAVGLLVSVLVGTYLIRPIRKMTDVALQVATGDLSRSAPIRGGRDEVGQMAIAFDQMIDAQTGMVKQIAETATQLASAATQIYAAAQEQEAAAAEQQVAVEEVARTMQSLLDAAGHIAESARGVLANAEQTRETTDVTGAKIAELSGHTNRIAEILEVIRDIADKSDLLALNASLEATRAGEAGRSFSLVAAEMRRLAERVTASVGDVKALVADVRASGTSTVEATERSRELAEGTTESARQITMVTQQQRTGTEQVSQSMRQFSQVLRQSVMATQQTRSSAEDMKRLADRLQELVGRFKVK